MCMQAAVDVFNVPVAVFWVSVSAKGSRLKWWRRQRRGFVGVSHCVNQACLRQTRPTIGNAGGRSRRSATVTFVTMQLVRLATTASHRSRHDQRHQPSIRPSVSQTPVVVVTAPSSSSSIWESPTITHRYCLNRRRQDVCDACRGRYTGWREKVCRYQISNKSY